ncbi:unnamed protein product [Ectocarpus sp. 8 AP-2014]
MIFQLLAGAIGAVLYVSWREATFESPRMNAFVAILDHLSYGTLKCCWWSLGNVWKTITRVKEAREHKSLGPWKLAKARENMSLERWYLATKYYKAYRDQVGVFNPTWYFTVARELKYCQQKKEEERRAEEEKRKKTRLEERRKVEDERRRKGLLRDGRTHRNYGRWELAITLFRLYLNDEGADLRTRNVVRAELHDCQLKKLEDDWKKNAAEVSEARCCLWGSAEASCEGLRAMARSTRPYAICSMLGGLSHGRNTVFRSCASSASRFLHG